MHLGGGRAGEGGVEVEHARKARAGAAARRVGRGPVQAPGAGRVGVGQAHVLQPDLDALARDVPACIGLEAGQRQLRLLEHARQVQRPVGDRDTGRTTVLGQVEVGAGARHPGPPEFGIGPVGRHAAAGQARQRQAADAALGLVRGDGRRGWLGLAGGHGRRHRTLPARRQALDAAGGPQAGEQVPAGLGQGHARGQRRQRRQVQAVGLDRGRGSGTGPARQAVVVRQPHLAGGPVQAVLGAEGQVVAGDLEALRVPGRHHPAIDALQRQFGQLLAQARGHLAQAQIGGGAGHLAALDVDPGAQPPLPGAHLGAPFGEVHIGLQTRDVDRRKVAVGLAAPVVPGRLAGRPVAQVQQGLAHLGHQAEGLAPFGRRCRVQPQQVAAHAVAGHEMQVLQGQRRLPVQLVGPAHGAALDHEFGLREKPVRGAVVVRLRTRKIEAGDFDVALRRAPDVEHRRFDQQLFEPQPPERGDRHRRPHLGQQQGFAALRVEQAHVAQLQRRHQAEQEAGARAGTALRLGAYGAHLDRYPHSRTGPALQVGTPFADSRHNPEMQGAPGESEQGPDRQHHPQQQPSDRRPGLLGSRGRNGWGRALIHIHCKL